MALTVTKNQDVLIRGAAQHETTKELRALLYEGATQKLLAPNLGEDGTFNPPVTRPGSGLRLSSWEIHNRAGAAISVGIGFRWKPEVYVIGDFDANGSPAFTPIADYKSRTAAQWAAGFTEADGDSLMVFSRRPWDWISFNVTTASSGVTTPTTTLDYTTISGAVNPTSAWTDVGAGAALLDSLTVTTTHLGTGEDVFVWNPPHDWAKTTPQHGLGSGIPVGMYGFRFIFDAVASTALSWTGIELGSMLYSGEELADNGLWENEIADYVDLDADGVVAFFETAAAGNMVRFGISHAG